MSLPTEDECYQQMMEHLEKAAEMSRRIAILREDHRWVLISNGLEGTRQVVRSLMAKRVNDSLGFGGKRVN